MFLASDPPPGFATERWAQSLEPPGPPATPTKLPSRLGGAGEAGLEADDPEDGDRMASASSRCSRGANTRRRRGLPGTFSTGLVSDEGRGCCSIDHNAASDGGCEDSGGRGRGG